MRASRPRGSRNACAKSLSLSLLLSRSTSDSNRANKQGESAVPVGPVATRSGSLLIITLALPLPPEKHPSWSHSSRPILLLLLLLLPDGAGKLTARAITLASIKFDHDDRPPPPRLLLQSAKVVRYYAPPATNRRLPGAAAATATAARASLERVPYRRAQFERDEGSQLRLGLARRPDEEERVLAVLYFWNREQLQCRRATPNKQIECYQPPAARHSSIQHLACHLFIAA